MTTLRFAVVATGALSAAPAWPASFDCALASSSVEKAICASPALSSLDNRLASAYLAAKSNSESSPTLQREQRAWLRQVRDKCLDESCLTRVYEDRIAALSGSPTRKEIEAEDANPPPGPDRHAEPQAQPISPAPDPQVTTTRPKRLDSIEASSAASDPASGAVMEPSAASAQQQPPSVTAASLPASASVSRSETQTSNSISSPETSIKATQQQQLAAQSESRASKEELLSKVAAGVALIAWISTMTVAKRRGWSKIIGMGGGALVATMLFVLSVEVGSLALPPKPVALQPRSPEDGGANKIGGNGPDVSKQPIPITGMLSRLRFGSPADGLPPGFIPIANSPNVDKTILEAGGRVEACKRYDNPPLGDVSREPDSKSVVACFDSQNRLDRIIIRFDRNLELFDGLVSTITRAFGSPSDRMRSAASSLAWKQKVRGVDVRAVLDLLPDSIVFSQDVESDPAAVELLRRQDLKLEEAEKAQYAKDLELAKSHSFSFTDAANELRSVSGRLTADCPSRIVETLDLYIRSFEDIKKVWGDDPVRRYYSNQQASDVVDGLRHAGCLAPITEADPDEALRAIYSKFQRARAFRVPSGDPHGLDLECDSRRDILNVEALNQMMNTIQAVRNSERRSGGMTNPAFVNAQIADLRREVDQWIEIVKRSKCLPADFK